MVSSLGQHVFNRFLGKAEEEINSDGNSKREQVAEIRTEGKEMQEKIDRERSEMTEGGLGSRSIEEEGR